MPEGLEAELYRRAADRCVGRTIETVAVDERQPMAAELGGVLPGRVLADTRRIGKLVLVDLVDGPTLGLHFGMTGRLVVDGDSAIERLEYASGRDDPAWDRFVIGFRGGGVLRVNDPRRWATFTLDPDEERLGPDFLSISVEELVAALGRRRTSVKAVLLDQAAIAGFGNLCADEVLWQAGVAPIAVARDLDGGAVGSIHAAMREHLPAMLARGGSHMGTISPEVRAAVPPCPRDGAQMRRDTLAGRTTIWCPVHQVGGEPRN